MPDPSVINEENISLLWKLAAGLSTILLTLVSYIWKRQSDMIKDHESRISTLERDQLKRPEFNNAMIALRQEFKEEQKNIIDETRICKDGLQRTIENSSHETTTRLDNFMALWAQGRRNGDK